MMQSFWSGFGLGALCGVIGVCIAFYLLASRSWIVPSQEHHAVFLKVRTALDEVHRQALAYKDDVIATRAKVLRGIQLDRVLSSPQVAMMWHGDLEQMVKLGYYTREQRAEMDPLYTAMWAAIEHGGSLVLMMKYPNAADISFGPTRKATS